MAFFNSAITVLQTLVVALGAGLGIWGAINLLEGYGNDNPGAKSQGMKQLMAGGAGYGLREDHHLYAGHRERREFTRRRVDVRRAGWRQALDGKPTPSRRPVPRANEIPI